MNDSQIQDYLQVTHSFLASRKQWLQTPEIISLTFKAVVHLLEEHQQSFQEHKTLINEQSLKIKELELRLGAKASKKDLENEVIVAMKNNAHIFKKDQDSLSEYDKLVQESRYEKEKPNSTTLEELKTIAEIISHKHAAQVKIEAEKSNIALKEDFQTKINNLKEELKNKFLEGEQEKRQMKNWLIECKQMQSKMQESHNRSSNSLNDEKINTLEHSQKKMHDNLAQVISHLQNNYVTKQDLTNYQQEKQKKEEKKSPMKNKSKSKEEEGRFRFSREEEKEVSKIVEGLLERNKQQDKKEWIQFKHSILKETGQMATIEIVNNLIDTFQKEMRDRYQSIVALTSKLQSKISAIPRQQQTYKESLAKTQKRAEKRSSPNKSIETIHQSIVRLEKTILDRQNTEIRKVLQQTDEKIAKYDVQWIAQLDRRERHLCQLIEQTYNQHRNTQIPSRQDRGDLRSSLKKLFETNLYCRYLYIGSKQCKKQSSLVWQKEVLNNIVENFIWKKDSSFILISSPGLYRVQIGIFGDIDTDSHILINGDAIALVKKPEPAKITGPKFRGSYFHQLLFLPAKCKLSLRMNQSFYGQAFLQLQQL